MLTPASILAAAMISLGLKAPLTIPKSLTEKKNKHQDETIRRMESLRRTYIVVTLISFCSELLAVMWGTVAVNQLTERTLDPAGSVWELLQRDVDLEWAAVNSHFVVGLIGFMYMVGLRGYVMLLEAEASEALMVSVLSGVSAALLLMVSIVNRGVESGGGDGIGYGHTVLDLFGHYIMLLYQRARGTVSVSLGATTLRAASSVGPLGLGALVLESVSVVFAMYAMIRPVFTTTRSKDESITEASAASMLPVHGSSDERAVLVELDSQRLEGGGVPANPLCNNNAEEFQEYANDR
ncbi:hypothetical protein IV203_023815 [Nitzschia inconspicua]|uniref:Uncharacterized protein n=1 Tax=Nitzschia inconspicua TaxID=303405 RepID=A0A9K3PAG2_9STRA|nr:hypothetical protein IV203_023815 [Nitzschia inconspicua]